MPYIASLLSHSYVITAKHDDIALRTVYEHFVIVTVTQYIGAMLRLASRLSTRLSTGLSPTIRLGIVTRSCTKGTQPIDMPSTSTRTADARSNLTGKCRCCGTDRIRIFFLREQVTTNVGKECQFDGKNTRGHHRPTGQYQRTETNSRRHESRPESGRSSRGEQEDWPAHCCQFSDGYDSICIHKLSTVQL